MRIRYGSIKRDENIAMFQPTIIIDSREQTPLQFTNLPTVVSTLPTGDYSVLGLENDFTVERKTIVDLIRSLTTGRERFMRELQRLLAYPFRRLLIIGSEEEIRQGDWKYSKANPKSILHSLHAIEVRGIPITYAQNPTTAASLIERWAFWRSREVLKISSCLLTNRT
jgi:ERCC4-type nuclease